VSGTGRDSGNPEISFSAYASAGDLQSPFVRVSSGPGRQAFLDCPLYRHSFPRRPLKSSLHKQKSPAKLNDKPDEGHMEGMNHHGKLPSPA
jgi:hypothetical protein